MLQTERLILRKVVEDDIDIYRELLSCPIITKYLPNQEPYQDQRIIDYVNNRVSHWDNGFGTFTIFDRDSDCKIGYVGVEVLADPEKSDIRFGIVRAKQGQGLAKEAALKCLEYTFDLGKHDKIYGVAFSENVGSLKTLRGIGMQSELNLDFYGCDGLESLSISQVEFGVRA